jgi:hypothetical protein
MPIARFQMPDGRIARFEVPDGTTPEQATALIEAELPKLPKQPNAAVAAQDAALKREADTGKMVEQAVMESPPMALARGVKDVLDTGAELAARAFGGDAAKVKAENDAGKAQYAEATRGSAVAPVGRIGGNIAATAPVGAVLAAPARAAGATRFANALQTGGFRTGGAPGAADMAIRMAGGAATGGVSAGLIDPEMAGTGAAIGAALPPAAKAVGAVGNALGRTVGGPAVPANVQAGVQKAHSAGYVTPPTQAKPTLGNRLLEGFAGKISTAQNASARNQGVSNALAQQAIGAADLTPQGLQAVRQVANQAYDDLAQVGAFQADQAFQAQVATAGGSKALPGIANKEVDDLVASLQGQGTLDAQQTIESIKRLRFEGSANKGAMDPTKKALGSAQMKIAKALEDLIDRNLQASGQQGLLDGYRAARQTLAKTYDVEKALTAAGNVDAKKLANALKKGRPLTGELRTIAEFADQFPKAAQTLEGMGSLPQTSPLDWFGSAAVSGVTGNPLLMAGVVARPGARAAALSPMVQNRLAVPQGQNALSMMLQDPTLQQGVYRTAPVTYSR